MSKLKEKWKAYVDTVPGMEECITPAPIVPEDADIEFQSLTNSLPDDIVEQVQESRADPDEDWNQLVEPQWCLCEMMEGDFPRVYAFRSLSMLAAAIAKREGTETAVWLLWGIPLRLSQAISQSTGGETVLIRYLLLPNQKAAVVSKTGQFQIIDQSLLPAGMEIQEEGWLGDPLYLEDPSFYTPGFIDDDSFSDDPDLDDMDTDMDDE